MNIQPAITLGSRETSPQPLNPILVDYLANIKKYFRVALAFSFFTNLLVLTVPLYMLQVYDRVLASRSMDTLFLLTLIAVVSLLALSLLDSSRAHLVARFGYRLDQKLSPAVIKAILGTALVKSRFPSVKGMRDLATIRNLLNSTAATALLDIPWMPIFFLVIFLLHPALGWLAVIGCVVLLGVAWLGESSNREALEVAGQKGQLLLQHVESGARSADAFEAMGISQRWIDRWMQGNISLLQQNANINDRNSLVLAISRFFRMGLQVAVLCVGAYLVLEGEITPGVMIAAAILISRALTPVEQSIGSFKSLIAAKMSFTDLSNLLHQVPDANKSLPLPKPKGQLDVENMTYFHPGSGEPCLSSINFSLMPGESLGIIGPSGAGKSTLSRLLVGTLIPRLGHVRLDGMDIAQWESTDRGQYIGYLPQNVDLVAGSVVENISRMNSGEHEKVIEAAKLAGAHEFIMRLPKGYDTDIGDQGLALSSGQRQRIGLARALYGDVSYVLLDEPNAHLDHDGEQELIKSLKRLSEAGITVIIVAHRPLVIQQVDKLLVLKNGRIADFGPRGKIMQSVVPV